MAAVTAVRPTGAKLDTTLLRHNVRLLRRAVALLALGAVTYVVIEIQSYVHAYPDQLSRQTIEVFGDNPAVRMLEGRPLDVDTVGGFVVWDGGWMLQLLTAVWAVLAVTRLLRGEEEDGRADLVLAAPVRPARVNAVQLFAVVLGTLVIGVAVAVSLVLAGAESPGSYVYGAAVALFGATFAGVGAVTAQLFDVRRRAAAAASGVLVLAFVLRSISNTIDANAWIGWFSPFGWVDKLHPFGDVEWLAFVPLLVAPVALGALALVLRRRRDEDAGLLHPTDQRRARLHLLGGPVRFGWRTTQGVLLAWAAGIGFYMFMMGSMLTTVTDFLTEDPTYLTALEVMGMDLDDITIGMVGMLGGLVALVVSVYAGFRMGAARTEESSGRLELVLSNPLARIRWLGGHALLAALSATLLAAVSGLALWVGAAVTDTDLSASEALRGALNGLPVVAVFGGLAVLLLGVAPRLAVPVTVTLAVVAYLWQVLGSALEWPGWVLDLSPFQHLAFVPAEPFAVVPAAVMVATGLALATGGLVAFRHRDLAGA